MVEPEILETRTAFQGRAIRLDVERVQFPNGHVSTVERIRHPGAAAMVPLTDDGHVLLVRQYRHCTGGEWLLEVPAGTLNPGETPETCALREVEEEAGHAGSHLESLGFIWTTPGFTDERIWLYLVTGLTPSKQNLDADETMTVERVPFAEQPDMAWANGQGRTRQVVIEPRDGSLARGCHWRISRAQVAAPGPFSRLPGIDRSLWLVAGDGLRLQVAGRTVELVRPLQRCDFAGELEVHAELCGGPVADLNVMTARAWGRAQAEVVELAAGAVLPLPDAPQRVVVVLRGQCEVDGVVAVDGDALRVHASALRAGRAHSAATALVVGFTPSA